jgi:hypothetical protein
MVCSCHKTTRRTSVRRTSWILPRHRAVHQLERVPIDCPTRNLEVDNKHTKQNGSLNHKAESDSDQDLLRACLVPRSLSLAHRLDQARAIDLCRERFGTVDVVVPVTVVHEQTVFLVGKCRRQLAPEGNRPTVHDCLEPWRATRVVRGAARVRGLLRRVQPIVRLPAENVFHLPAGTIDQIYEQGTQ